MNAPHAAAVPTWSDVSEASIVGGILMDPDALAVAVEIVRPEMFFGRRWRMVYEAYQELWREKVTPAPDSLAAHMRAAGRFEEFGGMATIAELIDAVPSAANIEYHCRQVRDYWTRRQLIEHTTATLQEARTDPDLPVVLDRAERRLFGITEVRDGAQQVTIKSLLWDVMEGIEQRSQSGQTLTGIPTGLTDLDAMTLGLQRGDLVLIGGRPSQGKTAVVTGIALQEATRSVDPGRVLFFSLETGRDQLAQRMLSNLSGVDLMRIRSGRLADHDFPRLAQAAGLLNTDRILIDDSASPTILDLRSRAVRTKGRYPDLSMIAVDYAQLVRGTGRGENRTQEMSEVSRGLKALAKELDVPVVALSQLSRAVESRPDRRPQMSDLRESGQLEQDADVIAFVFRPEYYFGPTDKEGNSLEGLAELIVAKQRNGATGTIRCAFHKECARFADFQRPPPRAVQESIL